MFAKVKECLPGIAIVISVLSLLYSYSKDIQQGRDKQVKQQTFLQSKVDFLQNRAENLDNRILKNEEKINNLTTQVAILQDKAQRITNQLKQSTIKAEMAAGKTYNQALQNWNKLLYSKLDNGVMNTVPLKKSIVKNES
jgi:chromosome segregation ATPase